jgi:hypothetical protein
MNKRLALKIERKVNRKLKKYYRDCAYFTVQSFTIDVEEGGVDIRARAGYSFTRENEETQEQHIRFNFTSYTEFNAAEIAALCYSYIVETLDDFRYFKEV